MHKCTRTRRCTLTHTHTHAQDSTTILALRPIQVLTTDSLRHNELVVCVCASNMQGYTGSSRSTLVHWCTYDWRNLKSINEKKGRSILEILWIIKCGILWLYKKQQDKTGMFLCVWCSSSMLWFSGMIWSCMFSITLPRILPSTAHSDYVKQRDTFDLLALL